MIRGQEGMRVGDVWINARSRDDIPKLLGGLRDVSLNAELREAVFRLLEERIGDGCVSVMAYERKTPLNSSNALNLCNI